VLLAAGGFLGVESLNLIGSYHHDNVVSIFFLLLLLIVCRQAQTPAPMYSVTLAWMIAAGASVGIGLGLKLTLAPYVVAIGCAPLFYASPYLRRLQAVAASATGGLVGFLAVAGFHVTRLYREYGNPVFPFFHGLSSPPFDRFTETRDLRFLPAGLLEYVFYPFYFAFDPYRVSDYFYRDFRLPIAFAVSLIFLMVLVCRVWRRLIYRRINVESVWRQSSAATVFLGVMAIGYVGWLCTFSYYRYAGPFELLSFVILALLLFDTAGYKYGTISLSALALLIIPTTRGVGYERRIWGHEAFVTTQLPVNPQIRRDAIVLIAGADAGSYFIPAFPASVRFLGVDVVDTYIPHIGQNVGPPAPASMLGPFPQIMHDVVARQTGQVLGVFRSDDEIRARQAFLNYGYTFQMRSCGVIRSNIASRDPLYLCALMHT
jgi:hypothetical protein